MARAGWGRIAAELVPLAFVLACLGLTLGLLGVALRRPAAERRVAPEPAAAAAGRAEVEPEPEPMPEAHEPPEPDAGPGEWLALMEWIAEEEGRAREILARAREEADAAGKVETEAASLRASAEAARARMDEIAGQIAAAERATVTLAVERDALRRRRDARRAELAAARAKAGDAYAVVPTVGPRGTWRQPIVLDCRDGRVTLLPDGPTFGPMDLDTRLGSRSSRIGAAVRRAAVEAQVSSSADGRPTVPYLLFLVRPDGIRTYYEARAALESLGIAFGYELIDDAWEIEVPAAARGADAGEDPVAAAGVGTGGGRGGEDELPVWTGERSSGSGLPDGPGGWRIGFAEALEGEMEEDRGAGLAGAERESLGDDAEMRAPGRSERATLVAQAWGVERPTIAAGGLDGRGGARAAAEAIERSEGAVGGSGNGFSSALRRPPLGGEEGALEGGDPSSPLPGPPPRGSGEEGTPGAVGSTGPLSGPSLAGEERVPGGGVSSPLPDAPPRGRGEVGAWGGVSGLMAVGGAEGRGGGGAAGFGLTGAGAAPGGWYDIRIVCQPDGVVVQPGGYRLTRAAMEAGGLLLPRVRDLARRGARAEDGTPLQPRLRFVVAAGGESMFWRARQQTTFAGLEWPATLQVAESGRPGGLLGAGSEVLAR